MIRSEDMTAIAATGVAGIEAMAPGEPLAVIVLVGSLEPGLELRHVEFTCRSNVEMDAVATILGLGLEAISARAAATRGSA
jgi:hypothetical protein